MRLAKGLFLPLYGRWRAKKHSSAFQPASVWREFEVIKTIEVHSDRGPVTNLNELDYVNGRIYANVWMSEQRFQHDSRMNLTKIVVIHPETGAVESFIDIQNIIIKASATNVPNGIAYRKKTDTFWLTGKYWNQVYEISLNAKNI